MSNDKEFTPGPIVPQPLPGFVPVRMMTTEGVEYVGVTSPEQPDPASLAIEALLGLTIIPLAEVETLEVI